MRSRLLSLTLVLTAPWFAPKPAAHAATIQMLVPGFSVEELPVQLSNQNNLRFAPDGSLTALGYDGRIWTLRDSDGDGLEDRAELFWDRPTLSVPLGMAWSTRGLYVSSKGKVSRLQDTDGDGRADVEEIVASGWAPTDVGSGGVDATAVTLDLRGNVYFGLLVADYSNAYRLRDRKDLTPADIAWLKQKGRWREPSPGSSGSDLFSLYDIESPRGTIQKWNPQSKQLSTFATGIRVPVALAFNRFGDLFNTDQEGETWMPHGNPLDELNHILEGKNYGFPPAHPQWLPGSISEPATVEFGPQHQSACGLVFNEPHDPLNRSAEARASAIALPSAPARRRFGPAAWENDAFVIGESRGKLWRVPLLKTPRGYAGIPQTIARLSMLPVDLAISPRGDLYVACHSGDPDWGTGPRGEGKIFRIRHLQPAAPVPLQASPSSLTEVRIAFDQPLHPDVPGLVQTARPVIDFGEYVTAGDRLETLKPPYAVVSQQSATPRGRLAVLATTLDNDNRTLVLTTDPHPLAVRYTVTLPAIRGRTQTDPATTIDLDYDFSQAHQPFPADPSRLHPENLRQQVAWAPPARGSSGTESRAIAKPQGDWESGRALFLGPRFQCSKCHRVRGDGGLAGPDLSNLIHRDAAGVLRDIREPNATLHPDYVTFDVQLGDGEVLQRFVRGQAQTTLQLMDVDGNLQTLERSRILRLTPSALSLMPSGLLNGATADEVRDLLTFLLWAPPGPPTLPNPN